MNNNTKTYHFVWILATLLFFLSCDQYYRIDLKNETKQKIRLAIKFDSIYLHKYWKGKTYLPFLNSYPYALGIKVIRFDSINLIKTYEIYPETIFPLEVTRDAASSFDKFESMTIMGQDTLVLKNKEEMTRAFSLEKNGCRLLIIK
jgi:hypothetical protein